MDGYTGCIVRKITVSTGIVNRVAGTNYGCSYGGDGGAASSANLNYPLGVAIDISGNLYIADTASNRIRKVAASTGIINTFAGTGSTSFTDNVQATAATLYNPTGVSLDSSVNVYVADYGNNRIRKITASTGVISTIAGTGTAGYSGDNGPATSATFNFGTSIFGAGMGHIVSDSVGT